MTVSYQYPESVPPQQYPEQVPSAYPGMLPPPVPYPKRRRWPRVLAAVLAVATLAAVVVWLVVSGGRSGPAPSGVVSAERAQAAIQEYLTALSDGDDETVARHALCGLFDAVKDRKTDMAVASLSSDAFRKQFSHAEVVSIDKIVAWSTTQAQVLFTMRVAPAAGLARGRSPEREQQAVAQLLVQKDGQDDDVLVCSYVQRTGGQY